MQLVKCGVSRSFYPCPFGTDCYLPGGRVLLHDFQVLHAHVFLAPHWILATWRSWAYTSISAEFSSGKAHITLVLSRISRFQRSIICWFRASSSALTGSHSRSVFLNPIGDFLCRLRQFHGFQLCNDCHGLLTGCLLAFPDMEHGAPWYLSHLLYLGFGNHREHILLEMKYTPPVYLVSVNTYPTVSSIRKHLSPKMSFTTFKSRHRNHHWRSWSNWSCPLLYLRQRPKSRYIYLHWRQSLPKTSTFPYSPTQFRLK